GVTGALLVSGAVWGAGRRIRQVVSFAETVSRSRLVGRVRCRASARGVTGFRQALPTPPATRGVEVHCVLGVAALVDGGADESLGVVGSFVELLERRLAREAAFQIVDCGRHVVGCVVTREFLQCGGVAAVDAVHDVLGHGPCAVVRHEESGSPEPGDRDRREGEHHDDRGHDRHGLPPATPPRRWLLERLLELRLLILLLVLLWIPRLLVRRGLPPSRLPLAVWWVCHLRPPSPRRGSLPYAGDHRGGRSSTPGTSTERQHHVPPAMSSTSARSMSSPPAEIRAPTFARPSCSETGPVTRAAVTPLACWIAAATGRSASAHASARSSFSSWSANAVMIRVANARAPAPLASAGSSSATRKPGTTHAVNTNTLATNSSAPPTISAIGPALPRADRRGGRFGGGGCWGYVTVTFVQRCCRDRDNYVTWVVRPERSSRGSPTDHGSCVSAPDAQVEKT